ncbi:MAG: sulfotransferase [Alphaproteobacteria bacterium]|nr:sulfotransferase [Alphaproteobacteria bacterium]
MLDATRALPWDLRALLWVAKQLSRVGVGFGPLEADALLEAASREAGGLTDFGEDGFREGLDVLMRSLHEDANLSTLGHISLWSTSVSALVARLRLNALRARRDPALDTPLVPPIVIIGLPRSGTTFLHRLLCQHPDARPLQLWELQRPLPGPGADKRLAEARQRVGMLKRIAPELDAKHHLDAEAPEECMLLFNLSFVSMGYWTVCPCHGYADWYVDQDKTASYVDYRDLLRIFQAGSPGQRLTLKAPAHLAGTDELLTLLPDACVVQTHRDIVKTALSLDSLLYSLHAVTSARQDLPRMAQSNLRLMERLVARNQAARRVHPGRVLDVTYETLTGDPLGTVQGIYAHFGLDFTADFEARLRAYIEAHPRHKHGVHRYGPEDFGVTQDELEARLRPIEAQYVLNPLRPSP